MKLIMISIIIVATLTINASADAGYIEVCDANIKSSFFSNVTEELFFRCMKHENILKLNAFNPISLNFEKSYVVDGRVKQVSPINDDASILILLSSIDGDPSIKDGVLRQIAYSDGHTEHEFAFTTIPSALAVDSEENYAYVINGLAEDRDVLITKIDLSTWQRACPDVPYRFLSSSIAVSNDGAKLYVKNNRVVRIDKDWDGWNVYYADWKPYWEIAVFDTSDLSELTPVEIDAKPSKLLMGYDNRLFITVEFLAGVETPLLVVDTNDDTVTALHYDGVSFLDIAIDAVNRKLYCQSMTQITDEYGYTFPEWSNQIYQIDIENQYTFEVFTLATENIALVEAVPLDDTVYSCRIFASAKSGNKVYYLDVE